jgi:diguanylate cyclase (GGDEF)-like protein/PAS domain S-box-containing protein
VIARFWRQLVTYDGNLQGTLDVITEFVARMVGEGSVLMLLSKDVGTLELAAVYFPDPEVLDLMREVLGQRPPSTSYGVAGTVITKKEPVILSDLDAAISDMISKGSRAFIRRYPIHSVMVVPLVAYGEILGTLGVMRIRSSQPYTAGDITILEALADRAAMAIADSRATPRTLGLADYQAIFRYSADGVMFTSPDGRILAANPAACEILRRSEKEICRLGRFGLLVNDDPRTRKAVTQRALSGRVRAEVPMITGDGRIITVDLSSTTFTTPDGQVRACVSIRDVSDQVALRKELDAQRREFERLSEHDVLTGLLNRRGFMVAAQRALDVADRESIEIQVMFCDLDKLKVINDTFGHQIGDVVLTRLGQAIAGSIRAVDIAARMSGDEFAVLLFGADPHEDQSVISRIEAAFREASEEGPAASFSVGVADRPAGSKKSLEDVLHEADSEMYFRKARRPNLHCW